MVAAGAAVLKDYSALVVRVGCAVRERQLVGSSRESNPSGAGALENFQLMTQHDDLEL